MEWKLLLNCLLFNFSPQLYQGHMHKKLGLSHQYSPFLLTNLLLFFPCALHRKSGCKTRCSKFLKQAEKTSQILNSINGHSRFQYDLDLIVKLGLDQSLHQCEIQAKPLCTTTKHHHNCDWWALCLVGDYDLLCRSL